MNTRNVIALALFPVALFSMAAKGDGCQTSEEPILPSPDAGVPVAAEDSGSLSDAAVSDSAVADAASPVDAAVITALQALCPDVASLDFVGATSIPSNPAPNVNVTVTSAATARAACVTTLAQAPVAPGGAFNCPADFGITYALTFKDANGNVSFTANAEPNGCGWILLNGTSEALWASADFWSSIATDIGVTESTIYPYIPTNP
jgi:hypothetical protein